MDTEKFPGPLDDCGRRAVTFEMQNFPPIKSLGVGLFVIRVS